MLSFVFIIVHSMHVLTEIIHHHAMFIARDINRLSKKLLKLKAIQNTGRAITTVVRYRFLSNAATKTGRHLKQYYAVW